MDIRSRLIIALCSRAVCNLIHMVMRTRATGKGNLGNAEAPIPHGHAESGKCRGPYSSWACVVSGVFTPMS